MIIKIFVSFSPEKNTRTNKKSNGTKLVKIQIKKFFGVLINKINNVLVLVLVFPSRKFCVFCVFKTKISIIIFSSFISCFISGMCKKNSLLFFPTDQLLLA